MFLLTLPNPVPTQLPPLLPNSSVHPISERDCKVASAAGRDLSPVPSLATSPLPDVGKPLSVSGPRFSSLTEGCAGSGGAPSHDPQLHQRRARAQADVRPSPVPWCPVLLGHLRVSLGLQRMALAALFGDLRMAFVRHGPSPSVPLPPRGRSFSRQLQPAWGSKGRGGNAPLAHLPNFSGWFLSLPINFQLAQGSPVWV